MFIFSPFNYNVHLTREAYDFLLAHPAEVTASDHRTLSNMEGGYALSKLYTQTVDGTQWLLSPTGQYILTAIGEWLTLAPIPTDVELPANGQWLYIDGDLYVSTWDDWLSPVVGDRAVVMQRTTPNQPYWGLEWQRGRDLKWVAVTPVGVRNSFNPNRPYNTNSLLTYVEPMQRPKHYVPGEEYPMHSGVFIRRYVKGISLALLGSPKGSLFHPRLLHDRFYTREEMNEDSRRFKEQKYGKR